MSSNPPPNDTLADLAAFFKPISDGSLAALHPGKGCPTTVLPAKGGTAEQGGFVIFYPSGRTETVGWRWLRPVDADKECFVLAGRLMTQLEAEGRLDDLKATNDVSVAAAIRTVLLDWNAGLQDRILRWYDFANNRPRM